MPNTPKFQKRIDIALAEALQEYDVEAQIRVMERHDISRALALELLEREAFTEGQ